MNKQTVENAVYEAQALTEEIAAITLDIQNLLAQRAALIARLQQLPSSVDTLRVPYTDAYG